MKVVCQFGFSRNGKYQIQTPSKRAIFTAKEKADFFGGDAEIAVHGDRSTLMQLQRDISVFNKNKMSINIPGIYVTSTVKQNRTMLLTEYEVAKGAQSVFKINEKLSLGSLECEITPTHRGSLGFIKRKMRMGTDMKYDVTFPSEADVVDKCLLIGAVFLINYIERASA